MLEGENPEIIFCAPFFPMSCIYKYSYMNIIIYVMYLLYVEHKLITFIEGVQVRFEESSESILQ